ncbi:hypothetical protein GCM10009121_05050 [Rhodanobacter soli]
MQTAIGKQLGQAKTNGRSFVKALLELKTHGQQDQQILVVRLSLQMGSTQPFRLGQVAGVDGADNQRGRFLSHGMKRAA